MSKKRILTLGLVVLLVVCLTASASALFGFGDDDEKKNEEVTITVSTGVDNTKTNPKIVKKFEEKYPNINVEYIEQPNSSDKQHDTYVTKLSSQSPSIDIMAIDIIWPAEFAAADWLLPLDEYMSEEELDKFLPGPIKGCTYNGHLYAVPWYINGGVLYYRKDIIDNPPETFDQLYNQAKNNMGKKGTKFGMTFQAKQYEGLVCDVLEYFWANGGQVLNDQGEIAINSPENLEALKFFKKLVQSDVTPEGVTTYDEPGSLPPFKKGKAVFHRNWPYAWSILQDGSKVEGKVGIVPMPKGPKGDSGASTLGGWNFAVNKFTDNKEAAIKFVKFATSYEMQKYNVLNASRNPTRKAVYQDEEVLEEYPLAEKLYDVFINAKPRPVSPVYPQLSDVMQGQIHKAINGMKSPEKALEDAQKEMEKILEETK